jgi:hypothetical protein
MENIQIKEKYILNVDYMEGPVNPREDMTPLGTMLFPEKSSLQNFNESLLEADDIINGRDIAAYLAIYKYEHGNILLQCEPFNCSWDSCLVGFIYITDEKLKDEAMTKEKAIDYMKNEVKWFSQYLNGEVFGFQVKCIKTLEFKEQTFSRTDEIDSCYGFYNMQDLLDHLPDVEITDFTGDLSEEAKSAYSKKAKQTT